MFKLIKTKYSSRSVHRAEKANKRWLIMAIGLSEVQLGLYSDFVIRIMITD